MTADIDVLLPVRAPAPWLEETIESLRNQSYSNWRLVLVMDGFSEEIAQFLENQRDLKCETVVVASGSGIVRALNTGLDQCSAPLVARIDADDVAMVSRFQRQLEYMARNSECIAVGSNVEYIDEAGQTIDRIGSAEDTDSSVLKRMRWTNGLAHPSVMFRRDVVQKVGGYREVAELAEDYDLWLRLAAIGEVVKIGETLLAYRVHSDQLSKSRSIPRSSRDSILDSRLALARSRKENILMARFRHFVWSAVGRVKALKRFRGRVG